MCSLREILYSPKFPKSANFIHYARNSNLYSSAITISNSSMKNSVQNITTARLKISLFFSLHQNLDCPNFPKNLSRYSNSSAFVTQNVELDFFCQGFNQKRFSCRNILERGIVGFVPWIGIQTVRYSKYCHS